MRPCFSVLVFALFASSCSKSEGPPGTNFIAGGKPSVVLNQQGSEWRIYVDGVDRTAAVGLKVKPLEGSTSELVQVEVLKPDQQLAGDFSLQYNPAGGYICQGECPAGATAWRVSRP